MTSKAQRPPSNQPWVWQTRELRVSDAWRSHGLCCRKLIDFLLLEHMNHGGKENGLLKAPYRQLEEFGIGKNQIGDAICEAHNLGLVDCHHGGMRVATTYALTWLPLHDGTKATNRWRIYRNPKLAPLRVPESRNLPSKQGAALPPKRRADGPKLPSKPGADGEKTLPSKWRAPSRRSSYQGDGDITDLSGSAAPLAAAGACG
jgi:hypothetical protein